MRNVYSVRYIVSVLLIICVGMEDVVCVVVSML